MMLWIIIYKMIEPFQKINHDNYIHIYTRVHCAGSCLHLLVPDQDSGKASSVALASANIGYCYFYGA